jgi:hypothetical protein
MKKTILLSFFCIFAAMYCNAQFYNHAKLLSALKPILGAYDTYRIDNIKNEYLLMDNEKEGAKPLIFFIPDDDDCMTHIFIRSYERFSDIIDSTTINEDEIKKLVVGGVTIDDEVQIWNNDGDDRFVFEVTVYPDSGQTMNDFVSDFKKTYGIYVNDIIVKQFEKCALVEKDFGWSQAHVEAERLAEGTRKKSWVKDITVNGAEIDIQVNNDDGRSYKIYISYDPLAERYTAIVYLYCGGPFFDDAPEGSDKNEFKSVLGLLGSMTGGAGGGRGYKISADLAAKRFNEGMYPTFANISAFRVDDDCIGFVGRIEYHDNEEEFETRVNQLIKDLNDANDLYDLDL